MKPSANQHPALTLAKPKNLSNLPRPKPAAALQCTGSRGETRTLDASVGAQLRPEHRKGMRNNRGLTAKKDRAERCVSWLWGNPQPATTHRRRLGLHPDSSH
jgi:hypothetical protein